MTRHTRKRAPVRENTTFSSDGAGNWTAHFAVLDVTGVGGSQEEAWEVLVTNANEMLAEDEGWRETFSAWAEQNAIEEEIPQEELRERDAMVAASHEASKSFAALTLADLDDAIASDTPVLIDFWAEWCMPCHMMAPVLKEVADDLSGRMTVAKLNTDDNHDVWARFNIEGIPTLILFRNGAELTRIVGAGRPKDVLIQELQPFLG